MAEPGSPKRTTLIQFAKTLSFFTGNVDHATALVLALGDNTRMQDLNVESGDVLVLVRLNEGLDLWVFRDDAIVMSISNAV